MAEAFSLRRAQMKAVRILQALEFRVAQVVDEMSDIGGRRARPGGTRILHHGQQRPVRMLAPQRQQRFGALVCTAAGEMEEGAFARYARIEAVLAGEADILHRCTQALENRHRVMREHEHAIDAAEGRTIARIEPFRMRHQHVVTGQWKKYRTYVLEHQTRIVLPRILASRATPGDLRARPQRAQDLGELAATDRADAHLMPASLEGIAEQTQIARQAETVVPGNEVDAHSCGGRPLKKPQYNCCAGPPAGSTVIAHRISMLKLANLKPL